MTSRLLARLFPLFGGIGAPVLVAAVLGGSLAGATAIALTDRSTRLPTTVVTVHHSRFSPAVIAVQRGTEVRFAVRNADPIAHEFIVGPPEVHERHERGTEATHGAVPGEVSVAPGQEAETTYVFDRPGTVVFACHLPGHFAYGMKGEIRVS